MCGICGQFRYDGLPVDRELITSMTRALAHRGPDGEGSYFHGPVGLGHRRLSIIDPEGGAEPLFNEDHSLVLIFNGEIYNYRELTALLLGHRFATACDAEVILHAYEEWGTACVEKFNGMWAFALWDERKRGLFLSRDRIGEKPLFYSDTGASFLFASEIKSLLAAGVGREPALELTALYCALGYIPAPYSYYKKIRKLAPGRSLWIDKDGRTETRYWRFPCVPETEMETQPRRAEEMFSALLSDAVRLRLRADVPFGAFLSGGLDSSSIVALMAEALPPSVSTFTVGFPEKSFDERPLARLVAERFATRHRELTLHNEGFSDSLRVIRSCFDEPFGDSSAIPMELMTGSARTEVTMALSGDGGDETLSGYPSYQTERGVRHFRRFPSPIRSGGRLLWRALRPFFRGRSVYTWNRIERLFRSLEMNFPERLAEKTFRIPPPLVRALTRGCGPQVDPVEFLTERLQGLPFRDPFYKLMYFHFTVSLPDDMLAKVDRTSMRHALEVRLPFLDHRVVEYTAGLHKAVKMRGWERKSLLKRTVGRTLPRPLLRAPKRGFVVPLREWFKGDAARERFTALTALTDIGLDGNVLDALVRAQTTGTADYGQALWILSVLREWFSAADDKTENKRRSDNCHRLD